MTKTSKADLSQSILTTRFKKEYLKTQASEKDAFFMSENGTPKISKRKSILQKSALFLILSLLLAGRKHLCMLHFFTNAE